MRVDFMALRECMCNATFKDMSLIGGQEDYLSSKQQIFDKKILNFITKESLFSESYFFKRDLI